MYFFLHSKVPFNSFFIQKDKWMITESSELVKMNHNLIPEIVYNILNRVFNT